MNKKKLQKIDISVNGKDLSSDEADFLVNVIETQKIEIDSLKDSVRRNSSIKKTVEVISSLSQKFSSKSIQNYSCN